MISIFSDLYQSIKEYSVNKDIPKATYLILRSIAGMLFINIFILIAICLRI